MLDEPDSGVDVKSLPHLGEAIRRIHSSRDDRAFERSSGIIVIETFLCRQLKSALTL